MTDAASVVASAKELAVLPSSYLRLSKVLDARAASAEQVAEAVKLDPTLTARLLKLANSAAFSPAKRVDSVAQATVMVGTSTLRRLALATGIVTMFRGIPEHLLSMSSFWTHSVGVGATAYLLALRARTVRAESAFVAGLLHDVGSLLICLRQPHEARTVLFEAERLNRPHPSVELEILGFTHADVGGLLLERWGLPGAEVAAAAFHHDPNGASAALRPMVDLVHVADVIVSSLQLGSAGERAANPLEPEAWNRTGLRSRDINALVGQLERQMGGLVDAIVGG
ncbi:MAG: HDOD domain-containing protein [Myxococcota bacterium]